MKDLIWLGKLIALPCGLFVSARFFQSWPFAALILGVALGVIGPPALIKQERYIAPAQRPKKTTVARQRAIILGTFGVALSACLIMLWMSDFLPLGRVFSTAAWQILGWATGWSFVALANARRNTETYNKWLSDMSPW